MRVPCLLLALFVGGSVCGTLRASDTPAAAPAAIGNISAADLKTAIDAKTVTILDVNGSKSYAARHIPGALDYEVVKADLAKSLPADKAALVVAYCGSAKCTAYKTAADAAIALGYTNVKHLTGGLKDWVAASLPVEPAATK